MDIPLIDRIGGSAAVYAVVELFYVRVLDDAKLAPFFERASMSVLKEHQRHFLGMAFGGPNDYEGRELAHAHSHLVQAQGLSDEHFDAVIGHLRAALEELDVPPVLVGEVLVIATGCRDDILGRVEIQNAA